MRVLFLEKNPVWLNGLPYGFRDAGHEIAASGPLTKHYLPRVIEKFGPDLIFTVGWGTEHTKIKQDWIRHYVKSLGVPHAYWATEDPHFTRQFTLPLLMRMQPDFVFTLSVDMVNLYRELGLKAAHLDFGFHPAVHRLIEPQENYRASLAVVANAYPDVLEEYPGHYRYQSLQDLIVPLLDGGHRIDFWGRGWEDMGSLLGREIPREWLHGYLTYPEAYKVYNSTEIILGLQNYADQATQRTYEVLGSGGFLLTSDTPAVRRLFEPGLDLVVSSSPRETLDLVNYYLQNSDEREQIRVCGRAAVEKYSYTHRAEYIIKILREEGVLHE